MTLDEFWRRVRKTETCWAWTGARTAAGYGNLRFAGQVVFAHRLAYELSVGVIPEGLVIDHLCRNRACVNPEHMEPVTRAENTRRGLLGYAIRTECRTGGHDITDSANVARNRGGTRRWCRPCQVAAQRTRRQGRVA